MRNFLSKMRYNLIRFMSGRYGVDVLNLVFIAIAFVINIVYLFVPRWYLYLVSLAFIVLAILRTLSRNVQRRYNENQRFLNFFRSIRMHAKFHIYKCPTCKQKIRIPRKRFKKVEIRCPKCSTRFIKRI